MGRGASLRLYQSVVIKDIPSNAYFDVYFDVRSLIPFFSGASLWYQFAYLQPHAVAGPNCLSDPRPPISPLACGCLGQQLSSGLWLIYQVHVPSKAQT